MGGAGCAAAPIVYKEAMISQDLCVDETATCEEPW